MFGRPSSFRCLSFDQAMIVTRTITNIVKLGLDYDDPSIMNQYIRTTKFTGCSGYMSIAQNSNDRGQMPTGLFNYFKNNQST